MAINNISKKCHIPRFDRGATKSGVLRQSDINKALSLLLYGAKLQAKKAYGFFSTAPGRLGFVQLHALSGVLSASEGFYGD
ncbi:hypothetical protein [Treponema sp. R80B11-R83G3]